MKKTFLFLFIYGTLLLMGTGCSLFQNPAKAAAELENYRAEWNNQKTHLEIRQLLSPIDASIYSEHEQLERIKDFMKRLPENVRSNEPENMARLYEAVKNIQARRAALFTKLDQTIRSLKPAAGISTEEAQDRLDQVKPVLKQLADFKDYKEYPDLSARLNKYINSLFLAQPGLLLYVDKSYRELPSETNAEMLSLALCNSQLLNAAQVKKAAPAIRRNFSSVQNAETKFKQFLKAPDQVHWDAFKSQALRIGYAEKDPARRRFTDYIRQIEHCRRIILSLKYWELAGTGFINKKKGDIGIRIWTSQNRPFVRQIAVENASRNWHSDPSMPCFGNQKKITHPLIARSEDDIIRMVSIHFQNSSGRTVESQVFEFPIWQLASLTWKTGSGELRLEGEPVNHAPGPYKGLVVMTIRDMPKLASFVE